jgi:hypothetical protein
MCLLCSRALAPAKPSDLSFGVRRAFGDARRAVISANLGPRALSAGLLDTKHHFPWGLAPNTTPWGLVGVTWRPKMLVGR